MVAPTPFICERTWFWSTGEPITAERRDLFVDSRAQSGHRFRIRGAALFPEKRGGFSAPAKSRTRGSSGFARPTCLPCAVELNHPTPFFSRYLRLPVTCVVPAPDDRKVWRPLADGESLPVSGPYALVYWRLNDKIRLRKNPRYWDAAHTQSDSLTSCQSVRRMRR